MQVTIDSIEPLDRILPVINALFGVTLALPVTPQRPPAATSRRSHRSQTAQPGKVPARRNKRVDVSASAVREWARSNGHVVSDRGRVADELLEAYRAAH
jgi:hypothetical protein